MKTCYRVAYTNCKHRGRKRKDYDHTLMLDEYPSEQLLDELKEIMMPIMTFDKREVVEVFQIESNK